MKVPVITHDRGIASSYTRHYSFGSFSIAALVSLMNWVTFLRLGRIFCAASEFRVASSCLRTVSQPVSLSGSGCGMVTSLMSQDQPAYFWPQVRSTQPMSTVATLPRPPASVERTFPFPRLRAMCPYPLEPPVQYTAAPRGMLVLSPGCRSLVLRQAVAASE